MKQLLRLACVLLAGLSFAGAQQTIVTATLPALAGGSYAAQQAGGGGLVSGSINASGNFRSLVQVSQQYLFTFYPAAASGYPVFALSVNVQSSGTQDITAPLAIALPQSSGANFPGLPNGLVSVTSGTPRAATSNDLIQKEPAMSGLSYWFPFMDNTGTTVSDLSGNGLTGTIAGTGNAAAWVGNVGLKLNDQSISLSNAGGLPSVGICGYWAAGTPTGTVNGGYYGYPAVGGSRGLSFTSTYGTSYGHGSLAYFPSIQFTGGSSATWLKDGITGAHCIEYIIGTSTGTLDSIVVDGVEGTYGAHGTSYYVLGAGAQTATVYFSSGLSVGGVTTRLPVIYSVWASSSRDTVAQAAARTAAETSRLKGLGVQFGNPVNTAATDSSCSITGTSIDQGYHASHPPSYYLAQDANIVCTITDMSVSGQASKDMDAGYSDREALIYHQRGLKDIAYNGGVTNGLTNYLEAPADALADEISWSRKAHAQGFKTIASTMLSRAGTGYNGLTGDVLAQQYNALLLANSDEFDWIANPAASPQLGATGANANTTYFYSDGVHPIDAGQAFYVAAEKAAFEGVYGTPSTSVSAAYTQIPSDRLILANSTSASFALALIDANYANFGKAGKLCVKNTGTNTVTLTPINSETIDGSSTLAIATLATACIVPNVTNPAAGGAEWIRVQ